MQELVQRLALLEGHLFLLILWMVVTLLLLLSQMVAIINVAVFPSPSQVNLKDEIIQFSYWICRESENGKDK